MYQPRPIITAQRYARLIAWTQLVLMLFAGLIARAAPISTRRLERYGHISLDMLARRIRNLIILRAFQIMRPRRMPRQRFNHAHAGFTRRIIPRQFLRSFGGSRLRRALRHRDPAARISILLAALQRIDAFARTITRYMTRLAPIIPLAPPCEAIPAFVAPAPSPADSS
jgi:hypothetical protein